MIKVGIQKISAGDFADFQGLETIDISDSPYLEEFDSGSISHLAHLKKLSIQNCEKLRRISGGPLALNNHNNLLSLALSGNKIGKLSRREIQHVSFRHLDLSFNSLERIDEFAFEGSTFKILKLSDNPSLKHLDENAFAGIKSIMELDLSRTTIHKLPHKGLKNLHVLRATENWALKKMPDVLFFTSLKEAYLTYPFHCCYFKHIDLNLAKKSFHSNFEEISQKACVPSTNDVTSSPEISTNSSKFSNDSFPARIRRWAASMIAGTWGEYHTREREEKPKNKSTAASLEQAGSWGNFKDSVIGHDKKQPIELQGAGGIFLDQPIDDPYITNSTCRNADASVQSFYLKIKCFPVPDALNPCEDIMGFSFLRISIWFVWILAILGNVTVLAVLFITRHSTMRVHYFLMANLAFADLCTGFYIAMLAVQDVRTAGKYYNFAVSWQTGFGCKLAGFLSVFASELSIVTMFLISFDAWYNTRYAFFHKTFRIKYARTTMGLGWAFSLIMAALPLVGISDYSVTSTCLPLDAASAPAKVYIMTGLVVNILAFVAISAGYIGIYCMINQSSSNCEVYGQGRNLEDIQVAKKMAILIATDFMCWAPTIFFGMTAAAGKSLISISVAKIFLVLFYPINSFANPFLYVFFTKVFRKNMSRLVRKHEWMQTVFNNKHFHSKTRSKTDQYYYKSHPPGTQCTTLSKRTSLSSTPMGGSAHSLPRSSLTAPNQQSLRAHQSSPMLNLANESPVATPKSSLTGGKSAKATDELAEPKENAPLMRRKSLTIALRPRFQPQMSDISEHSHSSNSNEEENANLHNRTGKNSPAAELLLCAGTEKPGTPGSARAHSRYMSELRTVVEEERRGSDQQKRVSDSGLLALGQRGLSGARNLWRRSSESSQSSSKTASSSALSSEVSDSQKFGGSNESQMLDAISATATPPVDGNRRHSADQHSLESGYCTSLAPTPEVSTNKFFELATFGEQNVPGRVPLDIVVTEKSPQEIQGESSWV